MILDKFFEKLGRKGTKKAYWFISGMMLIMFIVSAVVYAYKSFVYLLWINAAMIIFWPIITLAYIAMVWSWYIEDLMTEYKRNENVLSGGFAVLLLFAFPFIISLVLSKIDAYQIMRGFFEGLSSLMIAAMPAFIGLLGIQYSVAIQEKNRKEDLRLGAKPFLKIECCKVDTITDENKHTCHRMKIKICMTNISQNIGIPIRLISCDSVDCKIDFPYKPLAEGELWEKEAEVCSDTPYGVTVTIAVIYKDVYDNYYKATVKFIQHEKYELSETEIISVDLLSKAEASLARS